jgi:probable rRNA maturation factor
VQIHTGFPIFEFMQHVQFFFNEVKPVIQNRSELKGFISSLFKGEKKQLLQLNVIFCSDDFLLEMNKEHLAHNYYTDIITFYYSGKNEPIHAELYISIDRVRENAKNLNTSFKSEIHRVIFHGCMHLCGYGDKSSQQIKKMREREDYYLRLYFGKQNYTS